MHESQAAIKLKSLEALLLTLLLLIGISFTIIKYNVIILEEDSEIGENSRGTGSAG